MVAWASLTVDPWLCQRHGALNYMAMSSVLAHFVKSNRPNEVEMTKKRISWTPHYQDFLVGVAMDRIDKMCMIDGQNPLLKKTVTSQNVLIPLIV